MEISAGVGGYQQSDLCPIECAAGAVGESADAIYLRWDGLGGGKAGWLQVEPGVCF